MVDATHSSKSSSSKTIRWLKDDHQRLFSMMNDFKSIPHTDHKKRNALVDEIIRETVKHASSEEQVIYPMLRDRLPNGKQIYERNVTDDIVNKELLSLLLKLDSERDGELYSKTVNKFVMVEDNHLTEEEEWLDELSATLTPDDDHTTYNKLLAAYSHAPTRPHAGLWSDLHTYALGAKASHTVVAAVDRYWDRQGRPADQVHQNYPELTEQSA